MPIPPGYRVLPIPRLTPAQCRVECQGTLLPDTEAPIRLTSPVGHHTLEQYYGGFRKNTFYFYFIFLIVLHN